MIKRFIILGIMNIPIIFGILQNSLFLKIFKKNVKTKIIPLFSRMNFFSKLKNVNGKIIFVPYIQTGFKKIFTYISFLLALRVRGHRIILLTYSFLSSGTTYAGFVI